MISATTRRAKTIDYMVASAFVQFARGDGSDYINAQGRVDFDAGIAAADLDVVRAGTSYELRLGGGDVLTLQGAMAVRFADGENWTADDLIARARWEATPFADTYEGTDGNDVADGLAGNDFLNGRGGDDTLTGGDGADSIDGGPGHDVLMGGTGADWLAGRDGNDILDGGADNDQLLGEAGADNLRGGSGSDVLSGGDGDDLFDTGVGTVDQDTVIGGRGNDTVNAYGNQDTFSFARGDGQDVINTSRLGNNVFAILHLTDTLSSAVSLARGSGARTNDLIVRLNASSDQITISDFFLTSGGLRSHGIGYLRFSDFTYWTRAQIDANTPGGPPPNIPTEGNDTLRGTVNDDVIDALAGDDVMYGDAGNDYLRGDAGNDQMHGEAGNDTLTGGEGDDTMFGGTGDDNYLVDAAGDAVSEVAGGGIDTVNAWLTTPWARKSNTLALVGQVP